MRVRKWIVLLLVCCILCAPAGSRGVVRAEENLTLTETLYVEGGNAEDSASGIMPFSLDAYEDSFGQQLDGIALVIYQQMEANFIEKGSADAFTFEVEDDYGLSFIAVSGDTSGMADVSEKVGYAMSSALGAFLYDHPDVYWLHGINIRSHYSGTYTDSTRTSIKYTISQMDVAPALYYTGAADDAAVEAFEAGVQSAVDTLSAEFVSTDTDYEKAKKIHDWVNAQVTYDYAAATIGGSDYMYAHTAYPVFADGYGEKVVCEGYAKAFKILCDRFGLPCVLVSGMAYTSSGAGAHMWNYVQMPDGNWYAVDATWNDSGDSGYMTYFAVGANTQGFDDTFSAEHVLNATITGEGMSFVFPVLSEEAYDPEVVLQKGDITGDGAIDISDLTYMLQVINKRVSLSELSEAQLAAGNVTGEQIEIDVSDLTMLLQYINKRIASLG